KRALWHFKNFRLFYIDVFGNLHLHSVLPFNKETKRIDVIYGGKVVSEESFLGRVEGIVPKDIVSILKETGYLDRRRSKVTTKLSNLDAFMLDVKNSGVLSAVIKDEKQAEHIFNIMKNAEGQKGLQALELMQKNVRLFFANLSTIPDTPEWRAKMWEELGEVFEIMADWYSDETKLAKPGKALEFANIGGLSKAKEILEHNSMLSANADRNPTAAIVTGHNERKKFNADDDTDTPLEWIVPYVDSGTFQVTIDWQMSQGYEEQGGILTIFKRDGAGKVTGLRAWGFKEPKGTRIDDITRENLSILSKEQKGFLTYLAKRPDMAKYKFFLSALSKEEVEKFADKDDKDVLFDQKALVNSLAENEQLYDDYLKEENGKLDATQKEELKAKLRKFMKALAAGERFGLSEEQRKMIDNMADGVYYMKWFQVKSLKEVYHKCQALLSEAEKHGRKNKVYNVTRIRNDVADKLEKMGILIRPKPANGLLNIPEQEEKVFSREDYYKARFENADIKGYKNIISKTDRDMTRENLDKELELLSQTGLIEKVAGEGSSAATYRKSALISAFDNEELTTFITRTEELRENTIIMEGKYPERVNDSAIDYKNALIHIKNELLVRLESETKVVYHLIPRSLIPEQQQWIIQKIEKANRDEQVKEKIRFLTDEEYADYENVVRSFLSEGFIVNLALDNPREADKDKVSALAKLEQGANFSALGFRQKEDGNFEQIEGIIAALRAVQLGNPAVFGEVYRLLTGNKMPEDMDRIVNSERFKDPVIMISESMIIALPKMEVKDYQRLRELNNMLRDLLSKA
ncbi:MAG: hypothetical protein ABH883_07075, partial [Candidatus Omnitrophota bacterium]